jgi:SAM-dependent methyltransferase
VTEYDFDRHSVSYEELLSDPIRDRFAGADSDFFHIRKLDLIRSYFRRLPTDTRKLSYLDVGCGQGKLISLLRGDFARVAGCDVSQCMIDQASGPEIRLQNGPYSIPYRAAEFDVASVVCVYHHVPAPGRILLTREIVRVVKPGGTLIVIEHNPYNPVTRLIVSRCAVDREARLLSAQQTRRLLLGAGLIPEVTSYFLFFPQRIYNKGGAVMERWFSILPVGGQYAVFGRKQSD